MIRTSFVACVALAIAGCGLADTAVTGATGAAAEAQQASQAQQTENKVRSQVQDAVQQDASKRNAAEDNSDAH